MARKRPILNRFWDKVEIVPGEHWFWRGATNGVGYGLLHVGYVDGKQVRVLAHRFAYRIFYGNIPEGLVVDHQCNVTDCVRPNHLKVMTQHSNLLRGDGASARNAQKVACPQGHLYDEGNTAIYRGGRYCRQCARDRAASRRAAIREKRKALVAV